MGVKSAKKARKGFLNTSSVFDHEDDPEVRKILAKEKKQAIDCKIAAPQRKVRLSEAPGVEACGSADVPHAQKTSPAGEKYPTLCSL